MESKDSTAGEALVEVDPATLGAPTRRVLDGIDRILVYHIPLKIRFRRVTSREGLLLHGPHGWGEVAPFWDYDPAESSTWLLSGIEAATRPAPLPLRDRVPVNVTIPVCTPEQAVARVEASSGCATAKVKVADPSVPLDEDLARVEAVADALVRTVGKDRARLRVDANAAWDASQAITAVTALDRATRAGGIGAGLDYAEQPCAAVADLALVRRRTGVRIAADESIRRAEDPLAVVTAEAADVAVVKIAPLGGIERALGIAHETGLEVVISSALDTSVGLSRAALAAACLPGEPAACGLATAQLLAADVTADPLLPEAGSIPVDQRRPEEAFIGASSLPEGTLGRWFARLDAMCEHLLNSK